MEVKGYVSKVFDVQTGTSAKGNEWKSQDFILEYFEQPTQRWADKVLIRIFNDKVDELQLKHGDMLEVGFGHQVREYNGRYYNELTAPYRIVKVEDSKAPQAQPTPEPFPSEQAKVEQQPVKDDLPF